MELLGYCRRVTGQGQEQKDVGAGQRERSVTATTVPLLIVTSPRPVFVLMSLTKYTGPWACAAGDSKKSQVATAAAVGARAWVVG